MNYATPLPAVNQDSAPYWRAAREGRLLLRHCQACGKMMFYPRAVCPACLSTDLAWVEASGRGEVYSATICHRAPDQTFRALVPYVIALIDLDEGPRLMSNITGCEPHEVRIGARVEIWFDAATDEIGIPKFKLSRKST
jgi:uncharacterized OB-fold protein